MPSMTVILELPLDTSMMGSSSTFGDYKQKPRCRLLFSIDFAFDCALNASTQSKMQESLDLFPSACKDFNLTVNTKKTEIMYQTTPAVPYTKPTVKVGCRKLALADKFTYLGSTLSRTVSNNEEVSYRIACTSVVLADYKPACGKEVSNCKPNSSCTVQSSCLPSCMLMRLGSLQLPHKAAELCPHDVPQKAFPHQMAG